MADKSAVMNSPGRYVVTPAIDCEDVDPLYRPAIHLLHFHLPPAGLAPTIARPPRLLNDLSLLQVTA